MNSHSQGSKFTKIIQTQHLDIEIKSDIDEIKLDIGTPHDRYNFEEMELVQIKLNESKSQLDYYWNLGKQSEKLRKNWHNFTNIVDIYKDMRKTITNRGAINVSNAWMKYWEIFVEHEMFPEGEPTGQPYTAFFNAELPGAALCAYMWWWDKHVGVSGSPVYDWRASSYLGQGSLQDTYNLYRNNMDKWLMSASNDGDATKLENILDFAEKIKAGFAPDGVDLYSHDAGMNTSSDFNNQELINAKLHLGCALSGFATLKNGGRFIAKQYTFFETFTWNLILIYASLFDKFDICKPLTSRASNSEIYLIGKGFRGISSDVYNLLSGRLANFTTMPLISLGTIKQNIDLFRQFYAAAKTIYNKQRDILDENIKLYEKYQTKLHILRKQMLDIQKHQQAEWIDKYLSR